MAEPGLSVESQQRRVADARAAQDKCAEAVALMMLSQAFFEADRVAQARRTYLEAAQAAKGEVNRHQIRLAQSEALMARGLELVATEPLSQSAYRAFFSAGLVLEELEELEGLDDDGRAVREDAYARAEAIRDPYRAFRADWMPPVDRTTRPDLTPPWKRTPPMNQGFSMNLTPPADPKPPSGGRAGRMNPVTSVLWALVPVYTFGYGTFAVLGFAAVRLRARWLAVCSVVALLIMVGATADSSSAWAVLFASLNLFGPIIGGSAVTFAIRGKLAKPKDPEKLSGSVLRSVAEGRDRAGDRVDPAIRDALARRRRRAEAREILEIDPALARELGIGRPDLPRQYDDGGVLDVNHVPAEFLAELPGFTPELAARVVEARVEYGRFTLLSELVVYADVPEGLADELADRLVFLS